jgi:DNA-binding NarL/FixJ family response regulator
VKVAIVEDHPIMREVVRKVCSGISWIEVVTEAGTGAIAVSEIVKNEPDIVVLDIGLPDFDGFEVLRRIRKLGANPRVLIFSGYCSPYLIFRLEHADIHGFVDKRINTLASMREAFSAIRKKTTYFPSPFLQTQTKFRRDPLAFDKLLTNQQILILSMVADHFDDAAIAKRLEITERTVETHRSAIMRKLGLHTRMDMIYYAQKQGFMSIWPAT